MSFVGYGYNVLGYSPHPSFTLARWYFSISALILAAAIALTAFNVTAPLAIRVIVTTLGGAACACLLLAGVVWIAWRESEFAAHNPASHATPVREAPVVTTSTPHQTVQSGPPPVTPEPGISEPDPTKGSRQNPLTTTNDALWLAAIYESHTKVEADVRIQRFLGQWMKATDGVVSDVMQMQFDEHVYGVSVRFDVGPSRRLTSFLVFDDRKVPRVKYLHLGEKITAIGKIYAASSSGPNLDHCELLSP
jgi:hypothetical protein